MEQLYRFEDECDRGCHRLSETVGGSKIMFEDMIE